MQTHLIRNNESHVGPGLSFTHRVAEESVEELFDSNWARVYHTALRLLRSPQEAEDALQDAYLSAFRNLARFEGRSQFSTWLTRIVVNVALMRLRKQNRHAAVSLDESPSEKDETLSEKLMDRERENPEQACAHQEINDMLGSVLQTIPERYSKALQICDVDGLDIEEAAGILGVCRSTLRSQLSRGRRMMRREMGKRFPALSLQALRLH